MNKDYEVLSRTPGYRRHFKLDELRLRHRLFAGGWSDVLDRELIDRGDAVGVMPYDPAQDTLVMVEQFRVGALGRGGSPWLFEFVAGLIGEGETPEEVARRESLEEAGLKLLALERVGRFYLSPGGSTECLHLFCAKIQSPRNGGLFGLRGEGEDIRVHVVQRERALTMLAEGDLVSAWVVLALQWLQMNLSELRARWR